MLRRCKVFLCSVLIVGMLSSINIFAATPTESNDPTANTQVQQNNQLSESDKVAIRESLKKYDVNEETISNLLKKLEYGELWNSLDPQYRDTATHESISNENGITIDKYVYPDGSIMIQEFSSPAITAEGYQESDIVRTLGQVSGGTVTQGSGFLSVKRAMVNNSWVIISMKFYTDYTFVNGGYDNIDNVYDYVIQTLGGTYSNTSLTINKQTETSSGPALATVESDYSGPAGSIHVWLKLNVGSERAWATNNSI